MSLVHSECAFKTRTTNCPWIDQETFCHLPDSGIYIGTHSYANVNVNFHDLLDSFDRPLRLITDTQIRRCVPSNRQAECVGVHISQA